MCRCRWPTMSIRSVHSARIVLTQRSAYAFIFGHCGADFLILMPSEAKTASNVSVNLLSRSRIRERNASGRSPRSPREVPGQVGHPGRVRITRGAEDMDAARLALDHEEYVDASEVYEVY